MEQQFNRFGQEQKPTCNHILETLAESVADYIKSEFTLPNIRISRRNAPFGDESRNRGRGTGISIPVNRRQDDARVRAKTSGSTFWQGKDDRLNHAAQLFHYHFSS